MKKISYKLYNKSTDDLIMEVDSLNALGILRNYGDDIVTQLKKSGTKLVISKYPVSDDSLVEKLADLEHEQWMEWSKDLAGKEQLSDDRLKRWEDECWKPYNELSNEMKEEDRKWARKVIELVNEDNKGNMTKESSISDMFRGDITQDTIIKFKNIFLRLPISRQKEAIKNLEALLNSGQMRQPHIGKEMLDIANMIYNFNNNKNRHMSKLDRIKQIRAEVEAVIDNTAGCSTDINKESGDITTHNQPTPNQSIARIKQIRAEVSKLAFFAGTTMIDHYNYPTGGWRMVHGFNEMKRICEGTRWDLRDEKMYNIYAPIYVLITENNKYAYSARNGVPIDKDDNQAPEILEQYPLPKKMASKKTAEWDTGSTIKNDILMVFTTKDWVVYTPENKNGFKLLSAGTNWNMKNSNDIYVIVNKSNRNHKFLVSNGIISDIKGNKVSSNSFKSNEGLYNFIKSNIRMASKKKSAGNTSPETQYESAYQNNKQYANTYSIPKSAEFGNDMGSEAPMNDNEPENAIFQIGETVTHQGRPANIFDFEDGEYIITYEDGGFEQATVTEQELMSENQ